jgi:transcriptional regulator with XRE-family HTH domain
MEWSSENIRRLRTVAGMTQRELSQWLGVTIKQIKHLENRRRNPSGPSARLLDILAEELRFGGVTIPVIQVLATPTKHIDPPAIPSDEPPAPESDEAFVWR